MSHLEVPDLSGNKLLASLLLEVLERLGPHFSLVSLRLKDVLFRPENTTGHLYFPIQSVISSCVGLSDGGTVEVGVVGDDGAAPVEALLGAKTARRITVVQVAGGALRIPQGALMEEVRRGGALFERINCYLEFYLAQVAQTAACNRLHDLEQRLCRWLLMVQQRVRNDEFLVTHEILASMLGAPRSEVTLTACRLREQGLISYRPGKIKLLRPKQIELAACECYGVTANLK